MEVWALAHQEAQGIRMIKHKSHLPSAPFMLGTDSIRTADQLIQPTKGARGNGGSSRNSGSPMRKLGSGRTNQQPPHD